MSATSFNYRYSLNTNPSVADQTNTILYPFSRWPTQATSGNWYLGNRQIAERSFFGDDFNLSARPITRVIEPTVLAYPPIAAQQPCQQQEVPVVVSPVLLNDRFAAIGAQTAVASDQQQQLRVLFLVLLAIAGFGAYWYFSKPKK